MTKETITDNSRDSSRDSNSKTVKSSITKIICKKGTFYILLCKIIEHNDPKKVSTTFTAKGNINFEVGVGDELEITGKPVKYYNNYSQKEEWQLEINSVNNTQKSEKNRAIRILEKIKGIGPKRAEVIIEKLGPDCLEKIKNNSSLLLLFDFIQPEDAIKLYKDIKDTIENNQTLYQLYKFNLTDYQISRIKEWFGSLNLKVIKEKCFELTQLPGIGYLTAAKIADHLNIPSDNEGRLRACILYSIKELCSSGDSHVDGSDLKKKCGKLLEGYNSEKMRKVFQEMLDKNEIATHETDMSMISEILPVKKQEKENDDNKTD